LDAKDRAKLLTEIYREGVWKRLDMVSEKSAKLMQGLEKRIFSSFVIDESLSLQAGVRLVAAGSVERLQMFRPSCFSLLLPFCLLMPEDRAQTGKRGPMHTFKLCHLTITVKSN
jgi:hypothetical protein